MKWEIGYQHPVDIRREKYAAAVQQGFSILYLSDFHFNAYGQYLVDTLVPVIAALNPDIILLGGDYADSAKGLFYLDSFMSHLANRSHVFAVAGNHDYFFGLSKVQAIITRYGGTWIEKNTCLFTCKGNRIKIDGNHPTSQVEEVDFSLLCLHQPIDITPFAANYHLVFAGHLHGCQVVLWQTDEGLYPGRYFYKWNLLHTSISNCKYFISKGLGDTLPIRYNCKKDVIFVEVEANPDF